MRPFCHNPPKMMEGFSANNGKLLEFRPSRGRVIVQRNRKKERAYYTTRFKGNYIKTWIVQYFRGDKLLDYFTEIAIPTFVSALGNQGVTQENVIESVKKIEVRKTLLLKTSIRDYKEHLEKFKELTPDLEWYDD